MKKKKDLLPIDNSSSKLINVSDSLIGPDLDIRAIDFLENEEMLKIIVEELSKTIIGEINLKTTLFLLGLSKDFNPQTIFLTAQSSAGKNYLANQVLNFFPSNDVIRVTRLTEHAIEYHFSDKDMNGKILFIQEYTGSAEADGSIRPMISKDIGGLEVLTVGSDRKPQVLKVKGCPVLITTTTKGIDEQMVTRGWIGSVTETQAQTKAILEYQGLKASSFENLESKYRFVIQRAISLLEPSKILIPYAKELSKIFPSNNLSARRNLEKLLTLIKCLTYLYQKQRTKIPTTHGEVLLSPISDLRMALAISTGTLQQTLLGLPEGCNRILNCIKNLENDGEKPTANMIVGSNIGIARGTFYSYARMLSNGGFINTDKSIRPHTYSAMLGDPSANILTFLNKAGEDFFSEENFKEFVKRNAEYIGLESVSIDDTYSEIIRLQDYGIKEGDFLTKLNKKGGDLLRLNKIVDESSD